MKMRSPSNTVSMRKKYFLLPLFTLFFAGALFAGCDDDGAKGRYESYSNASRYSVGSGTVASASSIDVEWIGGQVNLEYTDDGEISFREESDFDLESNESVKMRWYLDGATLKIKYAESGTRVIDNLKKTLTVKIPSGTPLQELDVETVSADIDCTLGAAKADFDTVSGNIGLSDSVITGSLDFKTISGSVEYSTTALPYKIDAETVTGNLLFTLPPSSSFRVEFESVSGNFNPDTAFAGVQSGKFYTVGSGSTLIDAETVSGNLTITAS